MSTAGITEPRDRERSARFPLLWWDLAVGLVTAVMVPLGIVQSHDDPAPWLSTVDSPGLRFAALLAPLAGFVIAYLALGRRVLRATLVDAPTGPPGRTYLGVLLVVTAWAVITEPMYAFLQVVAYPIAWSIPRRYGEAVAWSAGIALAVGAAMFANIAGRSPSAAILSAGVTAVFSFIFAVAMGTWISRIFARGEEYRSLAEQLRDSQAEVAALSEASGAAAERERLSRELHDTLTQTLAGLVMLSEQAERALDAGEHERARDRLDRVSSAAREAVVEARALVATTQPLGDGGLEAAIERVAARLRADTGLDVVCTLEPVPLDRERQVVALRAAQEGLANARKHSRASRVEVEFRVADGVALLTVADDGVGPDAAPAASGGFGLSGLADRVRAVDGVVRFGPGRAPGGASRGALLEVEIPLIAASGAASSAASGVASGLAVPGTPAESSAKSPAESPADAPSATGARTRRTSGAAS